jgi:integrase
MTGKSKKQYPGASPYTDRHGKRRWRFRKAGYSAELGSAYGSPDFVQRYEAAVAGQKGGPGAGAGKTVPRSISALIAEYYRSAEYLQLAASTKVTYRNMLERSRAQHGQKKVAQFQRRHAKFIFSEMSDRPSAANNLRDRLITLMDLAIDLEWRKDNPVRAIKPLRSKSRGFHTWSEEEIAKFYATHAFGALAYTAMTLMLYTGAARVDAVKLGRGNICEGRVCYRRQKTENRGGVEIDIPIHRQLQRVTDALPPGNFTFLETRRGKSRSAAGLGNDMRDWCTEAGIPNCTSHGLRKAIARRLAEAGASPHEIMAVTGHKTLAEVNRYTLDANRGMLEPSAIARIG